MYTYNLAILRRSVITIIINAVFIVDSISCFNRCALTSHHYLNCDIAI